MAPSTTPIGIPIIKPIPSRKEGITTMSGFLAREKRTINESSQKNSRGLKRKPVSSNGAGRKKFPVAVIIAAKLTASTTTSVETTAMTNPSRKIARP